jgi:hypothetical protein
MPKVRQLGRLHIPREQGVTLHTRRRGSTMKLLTEYLDRAVHFEKLAAAETDPKLKEDLQNQAKAYRQLAAKRAQDLGLPPPSPPEAA